MQQYVYTNQGVAKFDTVEAAFTFTDVDGNEVEGKYSRSDLLELMYSLKASNSFLRPINFTFIGLSSIYNLRKHNKKHPFTQIINL